MKTVFIHIGMHKTGTTSLQLFMSRASKELAKQHILYPRSGRSESFRKINDGHHNLAFFLRKKRDVILDKEWVELAIEIENWNGDRAVISSEEFHPLKEVGIAQIKKYLTDCDLHAIVYVRNPLSYARSAYKQRMKMGTYAGGFGTFIRDHVEHLDYGALLRRWEEGLGAGRVLLRIFDKAMKNPGLEKDFCEVIGADFEPLRSFVDRPANVSPSDRVIATMRRINRLTWWMSEGRRRRGWPSRLRAAVRRETRKGTLVRSVLSLGVSNSLVKPEDIDHLRDVIGERHEAFLERYVAPEDRDFLRF